MTALLVYKNETIRDWAKDYQERTRATQDARNDWLDAFCEEHGGPPADTRGTFSNGMACVGVAWPEETPVPKGWRRPADDPRLIKPHLSTKIGKAAAAQLEVLAWPDGHRELSKQHGMPSLVMVPETHRYYTPGVQFTDDLTVWVTWGSRDVASLLPDAAAHGWDRVPLVEYIAQFGEEAL